MHLHPHKNGSKRNAKYIGKRPENGPLPCCCFYQVFHIMPRQLRCRHAFVLCDKRSINEFHVL